MIRLSSQVESSLVYQIKNCIICCEWGKFCNTFDHGVYLASLFLGPRPLIPRLFSLIS
jgi:hypothetical protein